MVPNSGWYDRSNLAFLGVSCKAVESTQGSEEWEKVSSWWEWLANHWRQFQLVQGCRQSSSTPFRGTASPEVSLINFCKLQYFGQPWIIIMVCMYGMGTVQVREDILVQDTWEAGGGVCRGGVQQIRFAERGEVIPVELPQIVQRFGWEERGDHGAGGEAEEAPLHRL